MLQALALPRLRIHHAAINTGFGDAVNQGVQRTQSDPVLVLNSDVRADDDFVAPLLEAMQSNPALAAITPAGNSFQSYDLSHYATRDGCVTTHNLYAYAFLIRRKAFDEVGGFDPAFGLGYYEDSDLSRKLVRRGYELAVHSKSQLHHEVHGSFEMVESTRALMAKNRGLYFERYPEARRRILLVSQCTTSRELPTAAIEACREALEAGAEIEWHASQSPSELIAMGMRGHRLSPLRTNRQLVKRRKKSFGRYTDLWTCHPTPFSTPLVRQVASWLDLERRHFE